MIDYRTIPQYQLEALALEGQAGARLELAHRETGHLTRGRTVAHINRVTHAYVEGFNAGGPNLENPYRRLNNFFAPQRRAWRAGHHKRLELDTAALLRTTP